MAEVCRPKAILERISSSSGEVRLTFMLSMAAPFVTTHTKDIRTRHGWALGPDRRLAAGAVDAVEHRRDEHQTDEEGDETKADDARGGEPAEHAKCCIGHDPALLRFLLPWLGTRPLPAAGADRRRLRLAAGRAARG